VDTDNLTQEPVTQTETQQTVDQNPDFIPFESARPPRTPGSRRAQEAERAMEEKIEARARAIEERMQAQAQALEQRLFQQQQENATLRGRLDEVSRQPVRQEPAPVRQDPADLRRQARKALDDKDFDGYERLNQQAYEVDFESRMEAREKKLRDELKQQQVPQIPPHIQTLISRHDHVAFAGDRGLRAVMLKENELDLHGVPPSPERTRKAFELANDMLKPKQTSQAAVAAASSAVPTGRNSGGGNPNDPAKGYVMNDIEKESMKAMGWTKEQWIRNKFPDKFR
jgi:hypothetical protein